MEGEVVNETYETIEEEEEGHILPIFIKTNQISKIEPEYLPASEIAVIKAKDAKLRLTALMWLSFQESVKPIPRRPIYISWYPDVICLKVVSTKPVRQCLVIQNRSHLSVNVRCSAFWYQKTLLKSGWRCLPATQFQLAPGLLHPLFVESTYRPKTAITPLKHMHIAMQLMVAYPRDHIFAFFEVPIVTNYSEYITRLEKERCNVTPVSSGTVSKRSNSPRRKSRPQASMNEIIKVPTP